LKVETDIIASITASLIGGAVIQVIMYIETFKTDVIASIGNIIMCLRSHCLISSSITVSSFILTTSFSEIKGKMLNLMINIYYRLFVL